MADEEEIAWHDAPKVVSPPQSSQEEVAWHATPQAPEEPSAPVRAAKGAARGLLNFVGSLGQAAAGPFGPQNHLGHLLYDTGLSKEEPKDTPDYSERMIHAAQLEDKKPGYAGNIGEFAGNPASYFGPGGLVTKLLMATGAGTGSEFLGEMAHEHAPGWEPAARIVGGLFGGPLAARTARPMLGADQQMLAGRGVTQMTPGQLHGGWLKDLEDKATSIPILGQFIGNARNRSLESFNRSVGNQALEPIGEALPRATRAGHDIVREVETRLSNAYDNLLPRMLFTPDRQFAHDITAITHSAQTTMPTEAYNLFNRIIESRLTPNRWTHQIVTPPAPPAGTNTLMQQPQHIFTLQGDAFKRIESELSMLARRYGSSLDGGQQLLGDRLNDVVRAMRTNLERSNPAQADRLRSINTGWAMYDRIRMAAANRRTSEGMFTPSDLLAAIKRGDSSVKKGSFARGDALMQDFAEAGQRVLPSKVADSGTAGRALMAGAIGATGTAAAEHGFGAATHAIHAVAAHPVLTAATLGALGSYTRPSTWALNRYANPRPGLIGDARTAMSNTGRGPAALATPFIAQNPFGYADGGSVDLSGWKDALGSIDNVRPAHLPVPESGGADIPLHLSSEPRGNGVRGGMSMPMMGGDLDVGGRYRPNGERGWEAGLSYRKHFDDGGGVEDDAARINDIMRESRLSGMGLAPRDMTPNPFRGQEASTYHSSPRETIGGWLAGDSTIGSPRRELTEKLIGSSGLHGGMGAIDFVPGIGQAMQVGDAAHERDPKSLAMALVPGSKAPARAADELGSAITPTIRRGLEFPESETVDRLRRKMAREQAFAEKGKELPGGPANERTVLKAPDGSGLPDFAVGNITHEDWRNRVEKMMAPEEIHNAAKWYEGIYDQFLKHTKGDEDLAAKYMRSWLVAQQNVDVSGAMHNALLQREQVLRGMPEKDMIAAGMPNPTVAARRVFQDKPIEGGVGHKIADFVDAAEGKDVRSWMNDHPGGGAPFVVDVHTARDTGLVDQRMINHLERLGYDPKELKKLKLDWGGANGDTGGLKEPMYENRARFGRELTQHLNDINWMGRNDWKPREVQAVGWMGMTKLTANKGDDVATGLANNMRHLSMELSPGEGSPWASKYGDRFSALPSDHQREITHRMSQSAIDRASEMAGIDVRDITHGTGGWMNYQNPSTVAQAFASKQGAEIAANALGHMLQQTEVWSNKVKPLTTNPKGFAVDIMASGDHRLGTDEGLREMWGKIMEADPTGKLFQGYQPIVGKDGRVGIRALIDRGGVKTKDDLENAVSGSVEKVLKELPGHYDTHLAEAEITKARNDWTKDKNGNGYTSRLAELLGRNPTADLRRHGKELEEEFRTHLKNAEAATSSKKGGLTERARGGRAYARGGRVTPTYDRSSYRLVTFHIN